MKIAEAIGAAFGTFSRIPVPKSAWTDFGSTHALAAFPLVGLAEGFLMTAWGHMANLLGVHRVTLNKALRELEREAVLGPYSRDEVYIVDKERVHELSLK